jgi:hypothetical protein
MTLLAYFSFSLSPLSDGMVAELANRIPLSEE